MITPKAALAINQAAQHAPIGWLLGINGRNVKLIRDTLQEAFLLLTDELNDGMSSYEEFALTGAKFQLEQVVYGRTDPRGGSVKDHAVAAVARLNALALDFSSRALTNLPE